MLAPLCQTSSVSSDRASWPVFVLETVSGAALPAPWAERFPSLTVPGETAIGGFQPTPLSLVTAPDGRELIQFGQGFMEMCFLDPATGQVVDMISGPSGDIVRGPGLVNSSLDQ